MTSPIDPHTLLPTKSKLPIKRKNPDTTTTLTTVHGDDNNNPRPPPFKFHRIWTEPDEIRFLQGLLDSAVDHLSFPRDLNVFYTRFSNTMSQPYSKSQLSEKLRRLRKKFRVISARLSKGLDPSLLSPHDRALYNLSKQLWHPDFALSSPFSSANCFDYNHRNGDSIVGNGSDKLGNNSCLIGVKVSYSPSLPGLDTENAEINRDYNWNEENEGFENVEFDGVEVNLSEVNVEFEEDVVGAEEVMLGRNGYGGVGGSVNGVGEVAAKAVINVFNEALEEVRMGIVGKKLNANGALELGNNEVEFEKRWQELRVAEMDVFARRLRLVLESSLPKQ